MMNQIAIQAIIKIILDFLCIFLTFWAIRGVRTEVWLKKNHTTQGQILYIFVSIALGYNVSNFIFGLITSSRNLIFLFE